MTDEEPMQDVRSAMDLRMEEMMARMDAMESRYQAQVRELQEANRSLWAAAHPAVGEIAQSEPASAGWDDTKAEAAFYQALGRE